MRTIIILTLPILICRGILFAQQESSYTDERDGKIYALVQLGDRWWFASNLDFQTTGSYSFSENKGNEVWGRLYDIREMVHSCPPGWRVPNLRDWASLKTVIDTGGITSLMLPDDWTGNDSASNSSGLSLVPSGFKQKKHLLLQNINGSFWFNDSSDPGSHWHLHIDGSNNEEPYYFHNHGKEVFYRYFAVRCVCEHQERIAHRFIHDLNNRDAEALNRDITRDFVLSRSFSDAVNDRLNFLDRYLIASEQTGGSYEIISSDVRDSQVVVRVRDCSEFLELLGVEPLMFEWEFSLEGELIKSARLCYRGNYETDGYGNHPRMKAFLDWARENYSDADYEIARDLLLRVVREYIAR